MDSADLTLPGRRTASRDVAGMPGPAGERTGADLVRFLDAMPAAFCFLDASWRFRYANTGAEQLIGRSRQDLLGRSLWEVLPATARGDMADRCRSAVDAGQPATLEIPWPAPARVEGPASTRPPGWHEIRVWPGPDGVAVEIQDVTERRRAVDEARRAAARTALVAQVSAELSGALDGESALGRLARLVVPVLTDGCIVTVVDREGRARDVGSWHADPARRELMAQYAQVRLEALPAGSPVARALRAGTPITETVDTVLRMMRRGPARDLLAAIAPDTAVVLPLSAEGRTVGVLTLYQDAGRRPAPTTSTPPGSWPTRPGTPSPACTCRASRRSWSRGCSAACSPIRRRSPGWRSSSATCRPPRPPGWAATGTTPSCSATAPRSSSSGTSSGTTRPRPPPWASCAGCCAASPTTAAPVRPRSWAASTTRSPRCTPTPWPRPWWPA